jgi:hypothetical protein
VDSTRLGEQDGDVGISVRVCSSDGEVMAEYLPPLWSGDPGGSKNQVNRLADLAHEEPNRYPLLAGIDPYEDTSFNVLQAPRVRDELRVVQRHLDSDGAAAAAAVAEIIDSWMVPGPGNPCYHRHLRFIGD